MVFILDIFDLKDLVYFIIRVPDTTDTSVTRVLLNDTSATRVKNFDLNNDISENVFSHPYISYMANERLQGEEQIEKKFSIKITLCETNNVPFRKN